MVELLMSFKLKAADRYFRQETFTGINGQRRWEIYTLTL